MSHKIDTAETEQQQQAQRSPGLTAGATVGGSAGFLTFTEARFYLLVFVFLHLKRLWMKMKHNSCKHVGKSSLLMSPTS